jgi:hypothetical protein
MTTLMLAVVLLAGAQATPEWARVTSLQGGAEIRIELAAGTVSGEFLAATADAIRLRVGGRETSIDQPSVESVQLRKGKSHRGRNAGVGLLIGMGVGAVIYGATCKTSCLAEGAPVWTAPMGLAGAVTGAVWPSGGWQTIYHR